jgi:hypothetical protein
LCVLVVVPDEWPDAIAPAHIPEQNKRDAGRFCQLSGAGHFCHSGAA